MTNRCEKKLSNSLASREMQMRITRHYFTFVRENKIFMTHTHWERCAHSCTAGGSVMSQRHCSFPSHWHSCLMRAPSQMGDTPTEI